MQFISMSWEHSFWNRLAIYFKRDFLSVLVFQAMQISSKCRTCIKSLYPPTSCYMLSFNLVIGSIFTDWKLQILLSYTLTGGCQKLENFTLCFPLRGKIHSMNEDLINNLKWLPDGNIPSTKIIKVVICGYCPENPKELSNLNKNVVCP